MALQGQDSALREGITTHTNGRALIMSDEVASNVRVPLNARQAGEYLNLSENMCRKLAYKGELPYLKMGTTLRFLKEDLDDYIQRSRTKSA